MLRSDEPAKCVAYETAIVSEAKAVDANQRYVPAGHDECGAQAEQEKTSPEDSKPTRNATVPSDAQSDCIMTSSATCTLSAYTFASGAYESSSFFTPPPPLNATVTS